MTGIDYAIVIGFLALMGLGGFFLSKLIRDSDDFFVAGRELTPFILCAAITATNLSMVHVVGMGGTAHQNGVSILWQNWTGNIALVLSGLIVLPLMRRLRIRSVPEFLQMRYSGPLRVLVALFWALRLSMFMGILLYLAGTVARDITGWDNYGAWLLIFCVVAIMYSVIGGAWAVAIMDSVLFVVTLIGGVILLPVAMHYAGGMPAVWEFLKGNPELVHAKGLAVHTNFVPTQGAFNWVFILGILLLSMKFAAVDQAILQRAFGAKSPRVAAKGMVLAGLVTTPIALLCILPGLAMAKLQPLGLHPELMNPDLAIPALLKTYLPMAGNGLLGIVLCGLVASQIDTITSDVNSVATLLTNDVYRNLKRKAPTQRQLLFVVRLSSVLCGLVMLGMAWLLQYTGSGAVNLNLTVVGILDMPLFVITIVYGIFWRRANWQGATAGFVAGGFVGVLTYVILDKEVNGFVTRTLGTDLFAGWHQDLSYYSTWRRAFAPILSTLTALIVTPIVSLMTRPNVNPEMDRVRDLMFMHVAGTSARVSSAQAASSARNRSAASDGPGDTENFGTGGAVLAGNNAASAAAMDAVEAEMLDDGDDFSLVPHSPLGKFALVAVLVSFGVFLVGVLSASIGSSFAQPMALVGLVGVLGFGMVRAYVR